MKAFRKIRMNNKRLVLNEVPELFIEKILISANA